VRYLLWIIKLALFALALSFAVKNAEPVTVRYYLGSEWQAPLVFVLLLAFCAGIALGLVAAAGRIFRQRRELTALRRELQDSRHRGTEGAGKT